MTKVVFVGYPDRFLVLSGTFVKDSFAADEALFDRLIESFRGR
jgi:hypothetical protein